MTAAKRMTPTSRKTESPEAMKTSESDRKSVDPAISEAFHFNGLAKSNGEVLETLFQTNQALVNGVAALNQEMMSFADQRMRAGFERTENLIGCSNPGDAFNLQCGFAKKAGEDYLAEAQKLMDLMIGISRECWAPVETRTRKALDDLGKNLES